MLTDTNHMVSVYKSWEASEERLKFIRIMASFDIKILPSIEGSASYEILLNKKEFVNISLTGHL